MITKTLLRTVSLGLLLALGLLGLVSPALAHEDLLSSTPAEGSALDEPPSMVTLEFSAAPSPSFVATTVTAADGTRVDAGAPLVTGPVVTIPVRTDIPAGTYTIGYRVTSNDGHPITGQVGYTVSNSGVIATTSAPTPVSTTSTPAPAPAVAEEGGSPVWPWFIGVVVVIVAVSAVVLRRLGR
ncbi:copper resistance CopC family protein [Pseudonocardia sp. WMMC193]|uniref:copper resistance CopC family protein n=1 Tax=Pseudonocardia sp. WMMC193 TaxID=2911965 RepID=UPI001F2B05BE|nr:copper resistance CopC family protein [Pseudonocardia sp. WMMC193]MCF7553735.1 copper resistance protein CopC [Pseudonocardia sp. WMMC193]